MNKSEYKITEEENNRLNLGGFCMTPRGDGLLPFNLTAGVIIKNYKTVDNKFRLAYYKAGKVVRDEDTGEVVYFIAENIEEVGLLVQFLHDKLYSPIEVKLSR